jgi:hypothetical protein
VCECPPAFGSACQKRGTDEDWCLEHIESQDAGDAAEHGAAGPSGSSPRRLRSGKDGAGLRAACSSANRGRRGTDRGTTGPASVAAYDTAFGTAQARASTALWAVALQFCRSEERDLAAHPNCASVIAADAQTQGGRSRRAAPVRLAA